MLADALYGSDYKFRRMLELRGQAYVLAVRSNQDLRFVNDPGLILTDTGTLAEDLCEDQWFCHTAGEGAKGPRLYEWARIPLNRESEAGFERWLLVRRSRRDPDKRAYYFAQYGLGRIGGANIRPTPP